MTHALRSGLRRAARQPRLAISLWLVNLVLAGAAAAPAFLMFRDLLDHAPEADRLLRGFSFGMLGELARADAGRFRLVFLSALFAAALALLANAFTSGGVLDILTTDDQRSFQHRFGRGAGRFFGRFLRAGIAAGLVLLLTGGLAAATTRALSRLLEDSPWPPTAVAIGLLGTGLVFGIVVVALLALDVARIRVVREDSPRAVRLYWSSLVLVLRHPLAPLGLWGGNALLLGLLLAAYAAFRTVVPGDTWAGIGLMLVAQQVVMLVRAGLRVALFAGEIALVDRRAPPPLAPETPLAVSPMG